jgi:hypothetical protein
MQMPDMEGFLAETDNDNGAVVNGSKVWGVGGEDEGDDEK